jgi:signal transduction histidine kinase
VRFFENLGDFESAQDKAPGLVVITSAHEASAVALARELWEAGPGWTVAIAGGEEPVEFRTVALGIASDAEAIGTHRVGEAGYRTALVDMHEALVQVARTGHDVNNALTAALAEVQILLMDLEDEGELREALDIIQEQLRRIRDLVANTGHLRPPRR